MDHHFRAFSFVDRITSTPAQPRIRGHYVVPAVLPGFSQSLVAEAVGQIAAWAAMAAVNFTRRPVAGIAGAIELLGPVQPGQTLELSADLESVDAEAVAYDGAAYVAGVPVLRLQHCVGPMVPTEQFDDPAALRARYDLLCAGGASPGAFGGVPPLSPTRDGGENGKCVRAAFQVPVDAPLFADHFPRRPVFPGSLLMHMNLELAAALAIDATPPAGGRRWVLRTVTDMKLRAFIPPGERLEMEARWQEQSTDSAVVSVETRRGQRILGGARVRLAAKAIS